MFKNKNLSVIAYANGFTLWHYVDSHIKMDQIDENFFSSIYTLCARGDKIMMNLEDGYLEVIITDIICTEVNGKAKIIVGLKEFARVTYDTDGEINE